MFDFLKRFFQQKPKNSMQQKPLPGSNFKKLLQELQPQIDVCSGDCIRITTSKTPPPKLESSKFGGLPCFPVGQEIPKDKHGKPMSLLAQLNFAEMPTLLSYPTEGLLQFYLAAEQDIMGLDFDCPTNQENWRVVFFEKLDFEARMDLEPLIGGKWEEGPLLVAPLSLSFEIVKDYPSYPSLEYYELIEPLFQKAAKGEEEFDSLEELYIDKRLSTGHKIGGFPFYTQNEIRESKPKFKDYQLLFQMDSDSDKIIWGDVGVGNFFIHKSDLLKKDFSKVLYNWDCH